LKLACKATYDESSSGSTTPRIDPFQIKQLEDNLEIVLKAKNQYYDEVSATLYQFLNSQEDTGFFF
jgi:hypothetical protein